MPALGPDAADWMDRHAPIIPCPEPDHEDEAQILTAVRPLPAPAHPPAPAPVFHREIALDPVILPMGRARSAADRIRLAAAALLSLAALGATSTALYFL